MKKFLSIALALVLVLGCASAFADGLYISVISKGEQHQFWQTVRAGCQAAADKYGVEMYYYGPPNESAITEQVDALKSEMAKNPAAVALAALDTQSVMEQLQECIDKKIPVIGFDSGVPNAPEGAIYATTSTNNQDAAAIAAEELFKLEGFADMLATGTKDKPVVIGVVSQDATSESITSRTTGFVNKMKELAATVGKVAVKGHTIWADATPDAEAGIIIHVEVSATTGVDDVKNSSSAVLNMDGIYAVFCSNEGAVSGMLAATADGSEFAEGGRFYGILVAGFDAGAPQKNAVRNGWFVGSVTQDPYQIGYIAVELAVKAANGEEVADVETPAQWYTAANIDEEMISMIAYD